MYTSSNLENGTMGLFIGGAFLVYRFNLNSLFLACSSLSSLSTFGFFLSITLDDLDYTKEDEFTLTSPWVRNSHIGILYDSDYNHL